MGAPRGFIGVQRVPNAGQSTGFFMPLQHQGADALRRFFGCHVARPEHPLGIEGGVLLAQAIAAIRDGSDPAPLAVGDFEHFAQERCARGDYLA